MADVEVHLAGGTVDRYDYGTFPMKAPVEDERRWTVCHTVTSEGALIVGVAIWGMDFTKERVTTWFSSFNPKVTYAPGAWVKVYGENPIREEPT